jgi:hypothetical protein
MGRLLLEDRMIILDGSTVYKRKDGSFTIDSLHGPKSYHAHHEATPEAYEAALAYADENPEMVIPEPTTDPVASLPDVITQACRTIDAALPGALKRGFTYTDGIRYQADEEFQKNMNAFMTMFSVGWPGPAVVRTFDNINVSFTQAEFMPFAFALMGFVQSCYQTVWAGKDDIRAAMSMEEAEAKLQAHSDTLWSIGADQ